MPDERVWLVGHFTHTQEINFKNKIYRMTERDMNYLNGNEKKSEELRQQETSVQRRLMFVSICMLFLSFLCSGCYNNHRHRLKRDLFPRLSQSVDSLPDTTSIDSTVWRRMADSLRFLREHHYSENFNFVVRADSLLLLQPDGYTRRTCCQPWTQTIPYHSSSRLLATPMCSFS